MVTIEDKFHLGSVGKSFTGMLTYLILKEKNIDFGAPISSWIPKNVSQTSNALSNISALDLTSHVAGIEDLPPPEIIREKFGNRSNTASEDRAILMEWVLNNSFKKEEIGKFLYSNDGYIILVAP